MMGPLLVNSYKSMVIKKKIIIRVCVLVCFLDNMSRGFLYLYSNRQSCGIVAVENVVSIVIKNYFQILIIKFKKQKIKKYHFQISGSNEYGR